MHVIFYLCRHLHTQWIRRLPNGASRGSVGLLIQVGEGGNIKANMNFGCYSLQYRKFSENIM